ncbi:hypothetical protein QP845_11665 [Staphylococcus epidermidis]|nr:hypothetical protein [Staphylococcus epidermidis]MDK8781345.1 hypothetical protein [Staphylococcus epidermidis]
MIENKKHFYYSNAQGLLGAITMKIICYRPRSMHNRNDFVYMKKEKQVATQ